MIFQADLECCGKRMLAIHNRDAWSCPVCGRETSASEMPDFIEVMSRPPDGTTTPAQARNIRTGRALLIASGLMMLPMTVRMIFAGVEFLWASVSP
jgi:hypothetical protein